VYLGGVPHELEQVWYHKGQPVFKFRGVDTISDAERFVGLDVCIPAADRLTLPEGEYFYSDLIGCRMLDSSTDEPLGEVVGWQEFGTESAKQTQILLEVNNLAGGESFLVPFASSILKKIDVAAREIRVELPPGLADLNR